MLVTGLADSHFLLNPKLGDGGILGGALATEDLPAGPTVMLQRMRDISAAARRSFTVTPHHSVTPGTSLPVARERGAAPTRSHAGSGVLQVLEGCAGPGNPEGQEKHPPSSSQHRTARDICDTPQHRPSLEPVRLRKLA